MAGIALTTIADTEQSLRIQTTLGDQAVEIRHFEGFECLSQPFEFSAHVISIDRALNFDDVLGQPVAVSYDTEMGTRYFHGIVGEMWQRETAREGDDNTTLYELKFYPQLWLLKFTADCRIFQNMSVMDIVLTILQENNVTFVQNLVTTAGQTVRDYCVQYNESCFAFVSRLLEDEGIYYYFTHDSDHHTLVLGDQPTAHQACPQDQTGSFFAAMGSDYPAGIVYECQAQQRVTISGRSLADYNFTTALTPIYAKVLDQGIGGLNYTYPGYYDAEDKPSQSTIEVFAKIHFERERAFGETLRGRATQPFFTAGHRFSLSGYDRPSSDGDYVLYSVKHTCTANTDRQHQGQTLYRNEFQAFRATTTFRAPLVTPRPHMASIQTARVTGQQGEEIWTDQYGRIKVKFPWDEMGPNAGQSDEKSSCWLRVAEGWAGNNWGMVFTPRIGMEVLVTFLDGNPDRPLVTGCVWNSANLPPYLPNTPTKSTIKSHSTPKAENDEFNELRFEDLRGSEQVYVRAQKDLDTYVRQTQTQHIEAGSQWTWVDRGDYTMTMLAQDNAQAKTTPAGQGLPKGQGDFNIELTGGNLNVDQLSIHGEIAHNHYIVKGDYRYQIDTGHSFYYQGLGNAFQQLDQGNREGFLKKGHDALVIQQGDQHVYLQHGHTNTRLDQGDQTTLLQQGDQLTKLQQGDRVKVIDDGSDYELLKNGSKYTTLHRGDHTLRIDQGNQSITLLQGNRDIKLSAGNQTYTIDGQRETTVMQSDTVTIMGALTIEVTGPISIVSQSNISMTAQNIELTALEGITMNAGGAIVCDAGMDISQRAGLNIDMESGMNITMASGLDVNISSGAIVAIEAGLDVNIAASLAVSMEGGASVDVVSAGTVNLVGSIVTSDPLPV